MVTLYTYNVLDDLTCVEQHGTATGQTGCSAAPSYDSSSAWRIRRFQYDSLGRLTTATNPESGAISYTYDADGNVLTKYDARGITTTMTYDQLHRVLTKTYSDGTPTVTMAYDGATISGCSPTLTIANGVGRRTAMCDAAGWESWAYNSRGHVTTDRRSTNNVAKDTTYLYNFADGVTSITYPSGHTITYTYNSSAHVTSASDVASSISYATNGHYTPPGSLAFLQNGGSLNSTYIFNSRLQPCWMSSTSGSPAITWTTTQCSDTASAGNILDYKYNFNLGAGNNGNVVSITNNITPARSQTFTYDELNRISTAKTQATSGTYAWGLSFGYDAWGNHLNETVTQGSANALSISVDPIHYTNRISGYSYDAAGNMLNDATNNYTYDAENRLTSAAGVTYTYDGNGNRVQKSNGKLYWSGGGPLTLDETDAAGNTNNSTFNEYVFFSGNRIARRDSSSNVDYYFADHLGTARVITNASGTIQDDSDFYPFGGERSYLSSSGNAYKFTGKERDIESGLDYFGARYYANSLGRFSSPDPKPGSALLANPQSWNRYTYTHNNPLMYADPDGMDIVLATGLSAQDRDYVVNNLARMYATPAGKTILQNADNSKFTITVGTGKLPKTDVTKASPGMTAAETKTKTEGANTKYSTVTNDGHTQLVAQSPDSPSAPPIQVIVDKDQSAENDQDPAKQFAHELGGHTADIVKAAEGNPSQYIDKYDPNSEKSGEAAAKSLGKVPKTASPEDVKAVEEILKPKEKPKEKDDSQ
jgi:RHS repeat-associated protein